MATQKSCCWRWVLLAAGVMVVALLGALGVRHVFRDREADQGQSEPAVPAPTAKQEIQDALAGIVFEGSWSVSPAADTGVLQERVVEIAEVAKSRMRSLRVAIEEDLAKDPRLLRTRLEVELDRWGPIDAGPMAATGSTAGHDGVRNAIAVLRQYKLVNEKLKMLVHSDAQESGFREGVQRLLADLAQVTAP